MVATVVATPDLGDTRAELTAFVNAAVRILGSTLMGPVMKGLVSDLATDPQLARAFQSRVVSMRLAEVERLLRLGVERGEIRADADVVLTHELLFGPVYYRLLLSGGRLDSGLAVADRGRRVAVDRVDGERDAPAQARAAAPQPRRLSLTVSSVRHGRQTCSLTPNGSSCEIGSVQRRHVTPVAGAAAFWIILQTVLIESSNTLRIVSSFQRSRRYVA